MDVFLHNLDGSWTHWGGLCTGKAKSVSIFIKRNLGLTDLSVYIVVSLLMYHLLVQVMFMYNKIKQQIKETEEDLFFWKKIRQFCR